MDIAYRYFFVGLAMSACSYASMAASIEDCREELASRMEAAGPALSRAKKQFDAMGGKEALGVPKLALSAKAEAEAMLARSHWDAKEADSGAKRSGLEAVEIEINWEDAKAKRAKARSDLSLGKERGYALLAEALGLELGARRAIQEAWLCASSSTAK
jgi:hypothetical protein